MTKMKNKDREPGLPGGEAKRGAQHVTVLAAEAHTCEALSGKLLLP